MIIGIDLGGTTIKGGLLNENGEIVLKETLPTGANRDTKEIVKDIGKVINILKEKAEKEITVVGVGVPGLILPGNAFLEKSANINMEKVNLKEELEALVKLELYIDNDANVAAIAEYEVGSLKNYESGILLTLGTGVGGGIIVNGEVIRGANGAGAEIGHMVVGENFFDCNCGRNGCLETYSSATGINKYTKKLLDETTTPSPLRDLNKLTAKSVFDEAKNGDEIAKKSVDRMVKYLSIGIVNLINILDPEGIAIGGGVSHTGDYLIDLLNKEIDNQLYSKDVKRAEIVLAKLQNDAGIVGAGLMAKKILNKRLNSNTNIV